MNRKRNPLIIPAAIGALVGLLIGCGHFQPRATPDAPESIGTLTPSETHVASAPVHATTDFSHAGVAGTDDDVPSGKTSLDVLRAEAATSGAVDVAPKTDGVTTGEAR